MRVDWNVAAVNAVDRARVRFLQTIGAQKNCALADCVNGQGASFDHVSTRGR